MASAMQVERKQELQMLAKELSDTTDAYDPPSGSEDPQSQTRRIELVNKAQQLVLTLTQPAEVSLQHTVNMSGWILHCSVRGPMGLLAQSSTTLTARRSPF